jgi:hypothetical protein
VTLGKCLSESDPLGAPLEGLSGHSVEGGATGRASICIFEPVKGQGRGVEGAVIR